MSDIIRLMSTYTLDIRDRRQVTFPSEMLKLLEIEVGDSVEVKVKEKTAIIKPKKQIALEALAELQKIFKESGISEGEMQKAVDEQRIATAKKRAKKLPN